MKTLYLECKMGASGDMIMAALYELIDNKKEFLSTMESLFHPNIFLFPENWERCGVKGTHMHVQIMGVEEASLDSLAAEIEGDAVSVRRHHSDGSSGHRSDSERAKSSSGRRGSSGHRSDSERSRHRHGGSSHHHHHSDSDEGIFRESLIATYEGVLNYINTLPLPEEVKENAAAVYRLIGEAEATVHNTTIEQIHFHELGTLDAMVDVIGCCLLFHIIHADQILASPIHVGSGTVDCSHGQLPVPAPATAELLKEIPYYTGEIEGELCTPTGAALLKYFVQSFDTIPEMTPQRIGFGIGTKEFSVANCIRAFLEDTNVSVASNDETVLELCCNLDDMTGEELSYAMEILFDAGALDVFYESIYMKKNRPGILLHCLCNTSDKERFLSLLFVHTTTRGVRYIEYGRATLESTFEECETPYGTVRRKVSTGYGITKSKYEFDDLKKIATEQKLPLREVLKTLP